MRRSTPLQEVDLRREGLVTLKIAQIGVDAKSTGALPLTETMSTLSSPDYDGTDIPCPPACVIRFMLHHVDSFHTYRLADIAV
ncbi:hypothetical protein CY34DRAFT_797297 [Suillus luteus UH-Slu-Lm8-n1]|uniref:Unplaced genomic scaffold CY34scaffold_2, whole genome shotgun sequence n=1 Tax=Suillus luteus UH-Slu-Lm8-n1 TaxID=930992 RepID=A0A0D0B5M4_9AGAM|nr:hypothetical protein CY34DRAFT_797297 [Suillus luteus UH-Slu-Lm8-n1]